MYFFTTWYQELILGVNKTLSKLEIGDSTLTLCSSRVRESQCEQLIAKCKSTRRALSFTHRAREFVQTGLSGFRSATSVMREFSGSVKGTVNHLVLLRRDARLVGWSKNGISKQLESAVFGEQWCTMTRMIPSYPCSDQVLPPQD